MSQSLQALWIVASLGSAVFACQAADRWWTLTVLATGFAASAALFAPERIPTPETMAGFAAAVAFLALVRPSMERRWARFAVLLLAAFAGGLLGGVSKALLELQGVPAMAAWGLAAALPAIAIWLVKRDADFAPEPIREEAYLLLFILGLGAAVVPGLMDGWRSAGALNSSLPGGVGPDAAGTSVLDVVPGWVLIVMALSALLGAAYAAWTMRGVDAGRAR